MNPRIIRFPTRPCWLCGRRGWYVCPSCQTVSCSLVCCLKHKEVAECTGDWRDAVLDGFGAPGDCPEQNTNLQLHDDANFLLDAESRLESAGLKCSAIVTPRRIKTRQETDKIRVRDLLTQVCESRPQTAEQRRVRAGLAQLGCTLVFSPFQSGRESLSYVDSTGTVHAYAETFRCDFGAVRARLVREYAREYFLVVVESGKAPEKPPF